MDLGNITTALNSATNLTKTVSNSFTSLGNASSVSGALNSITGVFSSIGKFFKTLEGTQLPLPNPLNAYASYDYIITLACLSVKEITNPDATYMSGAPLTIICKSANANPSNRVNTAYGKFDFFFQHLKFDITPQIDSTNTTTYNLDFTILEPYSMGLFFESLQTVAYSQGYDNWREANFLIAIEFRGNTENGSMVNIPGLKRYIPFRFVDMTMNIDARGVTYKCVALPQNALAMADIVSMLPVDASSDGSTVAEALQYGENSLQHILNSFEKEKVAKGLQATPNQYLIYFPQEIASASSSGPAGAIESTIGAIINPSDADASTIKDKLKLITVNNNLAQDNGDINEIGNSEMGYDESRPGDTPMGEAVQTYDPASKTFFGGKLNPDITRGDMKFDQKTNIPNAINQVILQSNYVKDKLDPSSLSAEGYRGWWRIAYQVFPLSSTSDPNTKQVPNLYVYKVIPYNVHSSRLKAGGENTPGFDNLIKQAVKHYNYIYTGKNDNILSVSLQMNNGFVSIMPADGGAENSDSKNGVSAGSGDTGNPNEKSILLKLGGQPLTGQQTTTPSIVSYVGSLFKSDNKGGGGLDRAATRAARAFQDALTCPNDIFDLNLKIMGDPYYIAHSGLGNYTSESTQYANLNADGTMNYENGEVDIIVNFRSPIDINQTTGLYNFGPNTKTAPVNRFSGAYCVTSVSNVFDERGQFTQTIHAFRRADQESELTATPEELAGSAAIPDPTNPSGSMDSPDDSAEESGT
jgi:hypothetical protein